MRSESCTNSGIGGSLTTFEDTNNNDTLGKSLEKKDSEDSTMTDVQDDLYRAPRYSTATCRPTMISAKYRQKEERRKMLKLSLNKLKRIEDPESSLRRSVLINNTVKRLQREAKEEKKCQSPPATNRCFGITSDFIAKQEEKLKTDPFSASLTSKASPDQLLDVTNLRGKINSASAEVYPESSIPVGSESTGRKRPIDEVEECDVLSQFYLPSTPKSLHNDNDDEDEDVNVVDVESPPVADSVKRRRTECCQQLTAADRLKDTLPVLSFSMDDWPVEDPSNATHQTFSCGQSSMLSEIVIYRNLIASLES